MREADWLVCRALGRYQPESAVCTAASAAFRRVVAIKVLDRASVGRAADDA